MLCTTIIPTIGRSTLFRAVESVLNQHLEKSDLEVIVVNDSGGPLAQEGWMKSTRVKVLNTNRHNRSVARNSGAAVSRSKYLHFLDDDDWMEPDAFEILYGVARESKAEWIYGGFHLVDNQGNKIADIVPTEHHNCFIQMIASEWIPLQASWIDSNAFFDLGGFASLYSLLGGYEDIDLARMMAGKYEFSPANNVVANIRFGDLNSSTDYQSLILQNRQSREKSLTMQGAFTRLRNSAYSCSEQTAYWHGRIIYYYIASMIGNLKSKRITTAGSRLIYAMFGFLISGYHALSPMYWKGLSQPHYNLVRKTLGSVGDEMFRNTVWRK